MVHKYDLEGLSNKLGKSWKDLALILDFDEDDIDIFDHDKEGLKNKSYHMLCTWKRSKGSSATYKVLYKALCHKLVRRNDLAEKYCIQREATEK